MSLFLALSRVNRKRLEKNALYFKEMYFLVLHYLFFIGVIHSLKIFNSSFNLLVISDTFFRHFMSKKLH